MECLVEPPWWGSEIMKAWWSKDILEPQVLSKVRRSLQRTKLQGSEIDWDEAGRGINV